MTSTSPLPQSEWHDKIEAFSKVLASAILCDDYAEDIGMALSDQCKEKSVYLEKEAAYGWGNFQPMKFLPGMPLPPQLTKAQCPIDKRHKDLTCAQTSLLYDSSSEYVPPPNMILSDNVMMHVANATNPIPASKLSMKPAPATSPGNASSPSPKAKNAEAIEMLPTTTLSEQRVHTDWTVNFAHNAIPYAYSRGFGSGARIKNSAGRKVFVLAHGFKVMVGQETDLPKPGKMQKSETIIGASTTPAPRSTIVYRTLDLDRISWSKRSWNQITQDAIASYEDMNYMTRFFPPLWLFATPYWDALTLEAKSEYVGYLTGTINYIKGIKPSPTSPQRSKPPKNVQNVDATMMMKLLEDLKDYPTALMWNQAGTDFTECPMWYQRAVIALSIGGKLAEDLKDLRWPFEKPQKPSKKRTIEKGTPAKASRVKASQTNVLTPSTPPNSTNDIVVGKVNESGEIITLDRRLVVSILREAMMEIIDEKGNAEEEDKNGEETDEEDTGKEDASEKPEDSEDEAKTDDGASPGKSVKAISGSEDSDSSDSEGSGDLCSAKAVRSGSSSSKAIPSKLKSSEASSARRSKTSTTLKRRKSKDGSPPKDKKKQKTG